MILDIWGIQVGPIIAGLGLFGVALALGAQDVFKNIFAGIFILSENRFQKGDRIRIGDSLHGIVDHIGFRSQRSDYSILPLFLFLMPTYLMLRW